MGIHIPNKEWVASWSYELHHSLGVSGEHCIPMLFPQVKGHGHIMKKDFVPSTFRLPSFRTDPCPHSKKSLAGISSQKLCWVGREWTTLVHQHSFEQFTHTHIHTHTETTQKSIKRKEEPVLGFKRVAATRTRI